MYELVSVTFPFANDTNKGKPRPGFVISPPIGKYDQVIVAYVTTQLDEILKTDIVLEPSESYFAATGLLHKSIIRLHRLDTFQPSVLHEGRGKLPDEVINVIKEKLKIVFQLK